MYNNCANCGSSFEITQDDLAFYDKVSPVFNNKKYLIPPPTYCPDCRMQRRLSFRNERHLYPRKCDLTGREIISIYAPDLPYKVYEKDIWRSDKWDPLEYGRDFNFNETFTKQFQSLSLAVPRPSNHIINAENSEYTNHSINMKNSYLVFGCTDGENDMYGRFVIHCDDTLDSLSVYSCEFCYEGVASQNCYYCLFFNNCRNCNECLMLEDCLSCNNCTLCFGLRGKEYCFFNEQLTKDEYTRQVQTLYPLTPSKIAELFDKLQSLKKNLPHQHACIVNSEDCTGDMVFNSKRCQHCFDITDCEDSKFLCFVPKGLSSYDATFNAPAGVESSYELCSSTGTRFSMSTFFCWYNNNIQYCLDCESSDHLFGCIGLKHKSYCIFNKHYSQEEYEKRLSQIVEHMQSSGEWGEFLSPTLSSFAYNESVAMEEFPMTKNDVLKKGLKWREHVDPIPQVEKIIPAERLPQNINDIPDDILNWAVTCEVSKRPYRILKYEIDFYRRMKLPIPHLHPDERHKKRLARRNPRRLYKSTCGKCGKEMQTTYSPDRPEKVYCEECYLKEVY